MKNAVLVVFVVFCVRAKGENSVQKTDSCSGKVNWDQVFEARTQSLKQYRQSVELAFKNLRAGRAAPKCGDNEPSILSSTVQNARTKCVSTKGIIGLESMPCFRYHFIPGREASKGTVISFMGGPGDIASAQSLEGAQYNKYNRIIFDDIGIGENSFRIDSNFSNGNLLTEKQTELVRRIIYAEKLKEYSLEGGSFGTVSATVVGSQLSQSQNPNVPSPRAVIMSGVAVQRETLQVHDKKVELSALPLLRNGRVCVLPSGAECLEDAGLSLLTNGERKTYNSRVTTLFEKEGTEPLRRLLKDAMQWYKVQGPEVIAAFIRKRLLSNTGNDFDQFECWYFDRFSDVPWIEPHKTASQAAFSEINSCFLIHRNLRQSFPCKCLREIPTFNPTNYQIKKPTVLVYINGDSDPQTPITEAERHYDLQKNSLKVLIPVCGVGHFPFQTGTPTKDNRFVSTDRVLELAFKQDLESLSKTETFCDPSSGVVPKSPAKVQQ